MNKDFSQTPRPTFKRALRRISVISVVISMTLVWLLLSTASIFTLKQYAQKNLELTAATMGRSLEAALVFGDSAAAEETLASLGKQGQISQAIVLNGQMQHFAAWRHEPLANKEQVSGLISKWLFPEPTVQPIWHQGKQIGELRLTALDELISHFLGISILVLTGSILLASFIALLLTHSLHRGSSPPCRASLRSCMIYVKTATSPGGCRRNVSRSSIFSPRTLTACWGKWRTGSASCRPKNAQLLRSSLHDPLTGLANRAAFRNALAELMQNEVDHQTSALLFLDGDNFKLINDNWGHAAGDKVLMEVASRLMTFAGKRHLAWRLGGDEFAVLLREVRSEAEVQALCQALTEQFLPPFNLHNGHSATLSLSVGYALAWEHATAESLQELADQNMYRMKNQRIQQTLK
ncbi:diguanylate cyclase DgcN [Klebsiella pneumoniae]